MAKLEELPIPNAVRESDKKAELVRIWIADGDQVVTISPRLWDDPGAWGLMLVDLARHVAEAYEVKGFDQRSTLDRIRSVMEAEWSNPTD